MDGMPTGAAAAGGGKKRTGYIDTTEFDICIASCSQNYTDPERRKPGTYYDCDGGKSRREGLEVLEEMELAAYPPILFRGSPQLGGVHTANEEKRR